MLRRAKIDQLNGLRHASACLTLWCAIFSLSGNAFADNTPTPASRSVRAGTTPVEALRADPSIIRSNETESASSFVQLEPVAPALAAARRAEPVARDPGPDISFTVVQMSLQTLTEALSKITGRAFTFEGDGKVMVRNLQLTGPLHDALEALSTNGGGMLWYSNGIKYTLVHGASNANVFRTIPFGEMTEAQIMQRVDDAFPARSNSTVSMNSLTRNIIVRGPRQLADEIDRSIRLTRTQSQTGVTIIRYGILGK